jgi:hypothetical protein
LTSLELFYGIRSDYHILYTFGSVRYFRLDYQKYPRQEV